MDWMFHQAAILGPQGIIGMCMHPAGVLPTGGILPPGAGKVEHRSCGREVPPALCHQHYDGLCQFPSLAGMVLWSLYPPLHDPCLLGAKLQRTVP